MSYVENSISFRSMNNRNHKNNEKISNDALDQFSSLVLILSNINSLANVMQHKRKRFRNVVL